MHAEGYRCQWEVAAAMVQMLSIAPTPRTTGPPLVTMIAIDWDLTFLVLTPAAFAGMALQMDLNSATAQICVYRRVFPLTVVLLAAF